MKKLSLISLIILTVFAFYSCEEDDNESGNDLTGNHEVYINGELMNVTEIKMYIDNRPGIDILSIYSSCENELQDVSFYIEPPALDSIEGTYKHNVGITTYNLDYSGTTYSILNPVTGERDIRSSRVTSEVTVTHQGDNVYLFELDMRFGDDINALDTITGYYTATFEQ